MGSIRIEIEYPHPPERVWTAITDPRAIAAWLMPNDFAPRHLAYKWKSDKVDTLVQWTLHETKLGTRLEFEHSGFSGVGQTILRKFMMGPGWNRMLQKVLPGIIDRVTPDGFVPGRPKEACS